MHQPIHIDRLYKKLFVKLVGGLVKRIGIKDIALAEDIVQETFLAAHQQWHENPPRHPEAWLFKVCKNIALKNINQTRAIDYTNESVFEERFESDGPGTDESLLMLVACANSRFSHKQQVIFALRYAAGFRVEQIAMLLGAPAETITKTLQRIRLIIREEKLILNYSRAAISPEVHAMLLKILYLMFCEGYKTSKGESILNTTLCEDALSLVQGIVKDTELSDPDAKALYALMLFNLSRFEARFTNEGDIVDLEQQDRTRWNQDMIALGIRFLNEAHTKDLSSYHIEGAIAYLHCSAKSFEETDWGKIVALYEQLLKFNESPFIQLNWAIAKFYGGQLAEAVSAMDDLGKISFINHYHLYHVALGKMLHRGKNYRAADEHYRRAIALTHHLPEKRYIEKLIALTSPYLTG